MPRRCTVCDHDEAHAINVALVAREKYRTVADEYDLSETALKRHAKDHIPLILAKAKEANEEADADELLVELKGIRDALIRLSDLAEEDGDYRTAIGGHTSRFKYAELLGRVSKVLDDRKQVNIYVSDGAIEIIADALTPYPEARSALVEALEPFAEIEDSG